MLTQFQRGKIPLWNQAEHPLSLKIGVYRFSSAFTISFTSESPPAGARSLRALSKLFRRKGLCKKIFGGIPIETRTGFLISQIKQIQGRVFQRLLAESGVEEFNGPQGQILYVLWQREGVPITELSHKTGLAKNTLTAMLGRMESAGLTVRRPSPGDRRLALIFLTEKARSLEEKYNQVSERMNQLFYRGMTQEDANTLDGLLDQVLANLQDVL